jgi:hypothetical protein
MNASDNQDVIVLLNAHSETTSGKIVQDSASVITDKHLVALPQVGSHVGTYMIADQ